MKVEDYSWRFQVLGELPYFRDENVDIEGWLPDQKGPGPGIGFQGAS